MARYSSTILAVGVPTAMNVKDLADFVARARAEPGKLNSAAVPGITEFAFDYFLNSAGVKMARIPYTDIVQSATDLGENRVQILASSYAILRPQQAAGRVKVLAVMAKERAPSLPDIPSAVEAGFPALDMEGLVGLFGTKAVSPELRQRIGADIVAVSDDREVEARLNATAQTPRRGGANEFQASIEEQRARVAHIAKELGIVPTR
jgi:tripartite-type tricarboxylate transporter receptor subunit TctC